MFNGASGALDSTWTQQRTSGTVNRDGSGSAVASITASHLFAFDNTKVYPANQYAKIVTGNMVASDCYNQVTTRASGVGDANYQCYYVQANINKVEIIKVVAGVHTSLLDNVAAGTANGDTVELRSIGTLHEMFVNGVSKGSVTDSDIASGSAGISIYDEVGGSVTTIASWEGGDFNNYAPSLGSLFVGPNRAGF